MADVIPEVYGVWPEPPCCGDPGDCNEPCDVRARARLFEFFLEEHGDDLARAAGSLAAWSAITGLQPTREQIEEAGRAAMRRGVEPELRIVDPKLLP